MTRTPSLLPIAIVTVAVSLCSAPNFALAVPASFEWTSEIGVGGPGGGLDIAIDGHGDLFVVGGFRPVPSDSNAFISKFDRAGNPLWVRELSTSEYDVATAVAADAAGNAYVSGFSFGTLPGQQPNLPRSAYLAKYDAAGNVDWIKQESAASAFATKIALDGLGNVYFVGGDRRALGNDVLVNKYDESGVLQWSRSFGSPYSDYVSSVAADALGNVFVGGEGTEYDDAYVTKYDSAGNRQWTWQGHADETRSLATDGLGNVYVTGQDYITDAQSHAFVTKLDSSGTALWTRRKGTVRYTFGSDVALDDAGNVYISGGTTGSVGEPFRGILDLFVSKYDATGAEQWTVQYGTEFYDYGNGIAVDEQGDIYLAREESGRPGPMYELALVSKLSKPIPEPPAWALAVSSFLPLAYSSLSRRPRLTRR
jgi:hypothetical protein